MQKRIFRFACICMIVFIPHYAVAKLPFDGLIGIQKLNVAEIESMLDAALEHLKRDDFKQTVSILSETLMLVKNNMDFKLSKLLLCSEVRDYNDYDAKEGFVINAGEPLLLYIEPEGYHLLKKENEYEIWVSLDAMITNKKGEVIFQRNNWVNYKRVFPTPLVPFYLTNLVRDIPAGTYTYLFTVKDHHKKAFFSETFEFVVR